MEASYEGGQGTEGAVEPLMDGWWHDFRKIFIENKICILIFPTTFVWNVSHSEKNSARCRKGT
jgi:hypothetical protein